MSVFWFVDNVAGNDDYGGSEEDLIESGTTADVEGTTLTDAGADFSGVHDGTTYVRVMGAGGTHGTGGNSGLFLVTAHTSTTLTIEGTSYGGGAEAGTSTGDVEYYAGGPWQTIQYSADTALAGGTVIFKILQVIIR